MYSTENYLWGGVAYLLGVLMLTPLLWWLTRAIAWHPVRAFFRILVLAFFLTPAFPYQDMTYLAPAWAVAMFEWVKPQSAEGVWRGLLPIGFSFAIAYALDLCVWSLLRSRYTGEDESTV